MPFIKLAATEIVSGVSGESEEKVRELFSRAVVRKMPNNNNNNNNFIE